MEVVAEIFWLKVLEGVLQHL